MLSSDKSSSLSVGAGDGDGDSIGDGSSCWRDASVSWDDLRCLSEVSMMLTTMTQCARRE